MPGQGTQMARVQRAAEGTRQAQQASRANRMSRAARRDEQVEEEEEGGSWRKLIKKKRQQATKYRIILLVRGRQVMREFTQEDEYRKWKAAYEAQMENRKAGIEKMQTDIVYR